MKFLNQMVDSIYERSNEFVSRYENLIFHLFCLLGVLPLLSVKYFVTLDGPAHLYNANIIKELLFGDSLQMKNLFELNSVILPNSTSHFFMAFLLVFLPSFLVEKIFLLFYFLATPIFFRKFILNLYPNAKVFTYLLPIFVHNQLLYFGFFNMSIGITFMFISAYYLVKNFESISWKSYFILALFLLLIFFSHVMIFLISLGLLFSIILIKSVDFVGYSLSKEHFYGNVKRLFVSALIPIVLTFSYFLKIDSVEDSDVRMSLTESLKWIIDIRPLLTLCYCQSWWFYTNLLFGLFVFIALLKLISFGKNPSNSLFSSSTIWLLASVFFLVLFFVLPNAILLSERLILLFYLFIVVWICSLSVQKGVQLLAVLIIFLVHFFFVSFHFKAIRELSVEAEKIEYLSTKMEEDKLSLTLNYSNDWLHSHISGYLGSNRAIPVIENYEAGLGWFPIEWSTQTY